MLDGEAGGVESVLERLEPGDEVAVGTTSGNEYNGYVGKVLTPVGEGSYTLEMTYGTEGWNPDDVKQAGENRQETPLRDRPDQLVLQYDDVGPIGSEIQDIEVLEKYRQRD
ncbi:hypothetical protein [Candidatus Nanohalobium constans]|uniref:Uncharacterized protein n=1 Tax=Candidatus Nanohalobium constans TaxID=2565781 RepID=A0A5Q0UF57_9ARCH|nr:hypothetical protein [Candidatus Nanohalobium constans]QGA79981.1 hypothetical protein LC1Nh_0073 [Candidatus Nanohalobium constans]